MTTNGQTYELTFGKQRIPFSVAFRQRERLAISVHPDRSVTVVAPKDRTIEEVISRVQKRGEWIVKQRRYFDQFQPLLPPRRFVAGETHLYLGRQYRLKLAEDTVGKVKLKGAFLWVYLADRNDVQAIQRLLEAWYRARAKSIFASRLDTCLSTARSLRLQNVGFDVRKMVRRWGSCTKSRRILLNLDLVKTPLHCIEYVIMHELCHLTIHDHSPQFYRLLTRCMPNWEERKRRLETFVL